MVTQDEIYNFMSLQFKVFPLWQYARENLQPRRLSLNRIAKGYSFKTVGKTGWISMYSIDAKYAMKLKPCDYLQPLLIIQLGKDSGGLMIDGLHRAYKLWKQGQKTIRAYYVTDHGIIENYSNVKDFNLV